MNFTLKVVNIPSNMQYWWAKYLYPLPTPTGQVDTGWVPIAQTSYEFTDVETPGVLTMAGWMGNAYTILFHGKFTAKKGTNTFDCTTKKFRGGMSLALVGVGLGALAGGVLLRRHRG